jgi:uridine kinase
MGRPEARSPIAREELLDRLAAAIVSIRVDHVVRVAVDGADSAGKTTFADQLAPLVARRGRPVLRISADGFHRPRAERYRLGELSFEGYYRDAFDVEALIRHVLEPLGPGGSQTYRRATFDLDTDEPARDPVRVASPRAVLLMDGVFLLRPELHPHWEFAIFLEANPSEILRRALAKDAARFGSDEHVRERYERRYLPAHELYESEVHPRRLADVVIENSDPDQPLVTRISASAAHALGLM